MRDYGNMNVLDKLPEKGQYDSIHDIAYGDMNVDFDLRYDKVIDYLGGLDALKEYVPFTKEQIRKALANGDQNLNTLPLKTWTYASGFTQRLQGKMELTYSPIWKLFVKKGIKYASPSECVCLLKRVATRMVTE